MLSKVLASLVALVAVSFAGYTFFNDVGAGCGSCHSGPGCLGISASCSDESKSCALSGSCCKGDESASAASESDEESDE